MWVAVWAVSVTVIFLVLLTTHVLCSRPAYAGVIKFANLAHGKLRVPHRLSRTAMCSAETQQRIVSRQLQHGQL